MWFTKITSSLSCSDSGEELETLSISSESESESSLILITPPTSTQCFGNFEGRALDFPSEGKERVSERLMTHKNPQRHNNAWYSTNPQRKKWRDSRFLLLAALFSLLGFSVGKCFWTNDWKTPLQDKNPQMLNSSSPTVTHNHRPAYFLFWLLCKTWFWLVYWWFAGDFSVSTLKKIEVVLVDFQTLTQQRRRICPGVRRFHPGPLEYEPLLWTADQSRCTVWKDTGKRRSHI